MNYNSAEFRFFAILAAGVVATTAFFSPVVWYLNLLLLLIFTGVLILTALWHDRGFYLACCGEALVVASSMMNIWAGLFVACMLAGIIGSVLGLVESKNDLVLFLGFCLSSLFVAVIIHISNHVLLPLVAIAGIAAIIMAVQSVRIYQFKKTYSGASKS